MNYEPSKEASRAIMAFQIVLQVGLFVAGLVSVLRKPLPLNMKWKWIPLLFVNYIGPIIYFAVGSRKLDEKVDAFCEVEGCNVI